MAVNSRSPFEFGQLVSKIPDFAALRREAAIIARRPEMQYQLPPAALYWFVDVPPDHFKPGDVDYLHMAGSLDASFSPGDGEGRRSEKRRPAL